MIAAFLLGLTGSLGHCVGMCSGVALLLGRQIGSQSWRWLLVHLGRITTYGLLGGAAGALGFFIAQSGDHGSARDMAMPGHGSTLVIPGLSRWQGVLAAVTAVLAFYMTLALIGRAPSPELLFVRLTRRWGRVMRRFAVKPSGSTAEPGFLSVFLLGMLWGLLPCGLVLAALLTATAAGSPFQGALTMLVFGLGTWPVNVSVGLLGQRRKGSGGYLGKIRSLPHLRYAAAVVLLLFSAQMGLRGLAAWGWVEHLHLGGVTLW